MNASGLLDLDLMQALPVLLALNGAAVVALVLAELLGGRRSRNADRTDADRSDAESAGREADVAELDALAALIREAEAADGGGGNLPRAAGSCRGPGTARRVRIA